MTLTKDQENAVKLAKEYVINFHNVNPLKQRPFIISGIAGSGKTFSVRYLINELGYDLEEVLFVAYTGKAADVLNKNGISARTIHSGCYNTNVIKNPKTGIYSFQSSLKFDLNETIKLLIVDEVSMVPDDIFNDIMSLDIPVIGLGDHNQIPPVGYNNCHDYVLNPDIRLTESIRHKDGNTILDWAQKVIINPYSLRYGEYGNVSIVRSVKDEEYLKNDLFICSTNNSKKIYNKKIREIKGIGLKSIYPVKGDLLISKINDWYKLVLSAYGSGSTPLINGLRGISHSDITIDNIKMKFEMEDNPNGFFDDLNINLFPFDGKNGYEQSMEAKKEYDMHTFEFGYAITTHLSQGSEYDKVIFFARDVWGNTDMRKKLLYTAITRAKKKLTIIM